MNTVCLDFNSTEIYNHLINVTTLFTLYDIMDDSLIAVEIECHHSP